MSEMIKVFTDGSCINNPGGPGGWGVVIRDGDVIKKINGGVAVSTNNQMELLAVIKAFYYIDEGSRVNVVTDSRYVKDGITSWIHKWKKNGWRTSKGDPVKNQKLWKGLDEIVSKYNVTWAWVKAHNGHEENEMADELAKAGIDLLDLDPPITTDQFWSNEEGTPASPVEMTEAEFVEVLKELKVKLKNKPQGSEIWYAGFIISSVNIRYEYVKFIDGIQMYYKTARHFPSVAAFKAKFTTRTQISTFGD